jgi:hypothetical protein
MGGPLVGAAKHHVGFVQNQAQALIKRPRLRAQVGVFGFVSGFHMSDAVHGLGAWARQLSGGQADGQSRNGEQCFEVHLPIVTDQRRRPLLESC